MTEAFGFPSFRGGGLAVLVGLAKAFAGTTRFFKPPSLGCGGPVLLVTLYKDGGFPSLLSRDLLLFVATTE